MKGKRPTIPKSTPPNIKRLLDETWKQDPKKRIRSFQLISRLNNLYIQQQSVQQLDSSTIEQLIQQNKEKDEKEKQEEFQQILSSLTEQEQQFINNIQFN